MKTFCRVCFSKIEDSVLFKTCVCHECFSKLNVIEQRLDILDCKAIVIYEYNEYFKSLLYQYKGCYDYALKDVFLDRFVNELRMKYSSYLVLFPPSNKEDDQIRGFNHIEEIASTLKLEYKKVFYKKRTFKQSDRPLHLREKIKDDIDIYPNINLKGRKILLIDDVVTSQNTIKTCILLLKKHQVKLIRVLILAKKV